MRNGYAYYRDLVSGQKQGLVATAFRAGLSFSALSCGLAVRGRNWAFDQGFLPRRRASVPVVSIGNLTLGGTGKTPAVEYVARLYRSLGRRVAILSRGYGRVNGPNDEALVLAENLPDVPHLQGKDRVRLARRAVKYLASEVLVLDDGFQHRRLQRDLDIVLVDGTEPWGHGRLFPRGLLREPLTGLRRAQAAIITRTDQLAEDRLRALEEEIARQAPGIVLARAEHVPIRLMNAGRDNGLTVLHDRKVAAFCGIGNPAAFRQTLVLLSCSVVGFQVFPDHHHYTREDVERLRRWAGELPPDCLVMTTQKDLVKLRLAELGGRPLWAVQVALRLTQGGDTLDRMLKGVVE
jgi:tetraacyldisaccharide 4'-kinase